MDDRRASTLAEPPPSLDPAPSSGGWRRWGLSFAFWSLLAFSGALSSALGSLAEGNAHPWWRALAWNVPDFYLWLLFSPLVVRLGRSTAGKGARRDLAVHLPASFLVAAAHATLLLLAYAWLRPAPLPASASLAALFRLELAYAFHLGLVTYWVVRRPEGGTRVELRLPFEEHRR